MPATIIGSTEWNQRGLVLTRMDAQEQVTGLVNVQVKYVGPASKHDAISRSFYQDAPPPIWPSVVNRAELVTNRLYMESRTVTRANGLTTVNASYVGGLQRAGFKGYFLRETVETSKNGAAYNYAGAAGVFSTVTGPTGELAYGLIPDDAGTLRRVRAPISFVYDETIKQASFVRIDKTQAATLPAFVRQDLATIRKVRDRFGRSTAVTPESADLWIIDGVSYERDTPVPSTETSDYITSTVKVVTRTYRLVP